jgi:Icc-related predicted phosphoesterase
MSSERMTRILCAASPNGDEHAIERLLQAADHHAAHAVALVGDLQGAAEGAAATAGYRKVFAALAHGGRPAYWVPGPGDAPVERYLREAHNIEVVATTLRGVHGTAALTPDGHTVVAGFGGQVSDDPAARRDEVGTLHYPRWEPEYRLKILGELDEHRVVMLFATPPAHKGRGGEGSEALTELIATHRARLVVSGGNRSVELIGRTLVVAPGSLAAGHYAIADLEAQTAEMQELAAAV